MATVPTQDRLALSHPRTGITLGVYPSSDPTYDLQLYRAASTSGTSQPTSSRFSELATLGVINGAARVSYQDTLPLSQTFWWYKAREVRPNFATPSPFTTGVVAQAGVLPTTAPGAVPFSGRPLNVKVVMTSAAVKSTQPVLNTNQIDFNAAAATFGSTASFALSTCSITEGTTVAGTGYPLIALRPKTTAVQTAWLNLVVPRGCYPSKLALYFTRKGTHSTATARVSFCRLPFQSVPFILTTMSAPAGANLKNLGGVITSTLSIVSQSAWGQGYNVTVRLRLASSGGSASTVCAFYGGSLQWQKPSLDTAW